MTASTETTKLSQFVHAAVEHPERINVGVLWTIVLAALAISLTGAIAVRLALS